MRAGLRNRHCYHSNTFGSAGRLSYLTSKF
ncbi:hypothetical protein P3T24_000348 [Paraburkholderia sp. GAS33]